MKRKSLFWLALIALSMLSTSVFAQFAGGSGTQNDPWQIASAQHLNNLRNYLGPGHRNKHFIQTADIDLGVPPYNQGEGWEPIGVIGPGSQFESSYDGAGHKISGLYINRPDENHQALFGILFGSVRDLELEDVNVTGRSIVGALVGHHAGWNVVINGCHSSGYVQGFGSIGGLLGLSAYSKLSDCHSSATVTGVEYTGGLMGLTESAEIHNCHSSATVTGAQYTGGLIGIVFNDTIIFNSHSSGKVSGEYATGGFVGVFAHEIVGGDYQGFAIHCHSSAEVWGVTKTGGFMGSSAFPISFCHSTGVVNGQNRTGGFVGETSVYTANCFSTGSVFGIQDTGGFVGRNYGNTSQCYSQGEVWGEENTGGLAGKNLGYIRNCYSAANVHGNDNTGGLAGENSAFISTSYSYGGVFGQENTGGLVGTNQPSNTQILSSYWDMEASAQSSSDGGQGRLTAQMVFPHSDDSYVGWGWEIWATDDEHSINGGYPYLRAIYNDTEVDEPVPPPPENIISVFPQPAFKAPTISIKSETAGKLSYTIYNVRGQKLYSAEIYSHEKEQNFELPGEAWQQLSSGVFLLTLERGKQRIASSRMVVVK